MRQLNDIICLFAGALQNDSGVMMLYQKTQFALLFLLTKTFYLFSWDRARDKKLLPN